MIGEENVPLLDVFNALGRLTKDGKIDTKERRKVKELQDLDIICGSATCNLDYEITDQKVLDDYRSHMKEVYKVVKSPDLTCEKL